MATGIAHYSVFSSIKFFCSIYHYLVCVQYFVCFSSYICSQHVIVCSITNYSLSRMVAALISSLAWWGERWKLRVSSINTIGCMDRFNKLYKWMKAFKNGMRTWFKHQHLHLYPNLVLGINIRNALMTVLTAALRSETWTSAPALYFHLRRLPETIKEMINCDWNMGMRSNFRWRNRNDWRLFTWMIHRKNAGKLWSVSALLLGA